MEVFAGILIGLAFGFLIGWHCRGEVREETITPIQSAVAYVPVGDCEECASRLSASEEYDARWSDDERRAWWAKSLENPMPRARRVLDRHGHCTLCGSDQISFRRLEITLPAQADVELAIRRAARARAERVTS